MARDFNDGPENFAGYIRSLQQNILREDRWRNSWVFRDQMFDLRCNGTVKRIGLILWALPLLCVALSTCVSVVSSYSSAGLAFALCALLGIPALGASAAAIWTAVFLRPPRPRGFLHSHRHEHRH